MISGMQSIQLHALVSISQKLHMILPPNLSVLQLSDWSLHLNQILTTIICLDELELRNTHTHTSIQL